MTLKIDTGASTALYYTPMDQIIDSLPDDATQDDIDSAYAAMVCRQIAEPKKLETARKALCFHLMQIGAIAERYPERFDQVILAYVERMNAALCINRTNPSGVRDDQ